MSVTKRARDFAIFFGGILLGILGNLFAEFFIALLYPDGVIPSDKAIVSVKIIIIAIIIETIVIGVAIMVKPSD